MKKLLSSTIHQFSYRCGHSYYTTARVLDSRTERLITRNPCPTCTREKFKKKEQQQNG